ncbi:flagellar filament capping protein FliD [Anaerospora hongkongensis]|uniref:flagellar filament capping protein FliD n=1 Tax=Anaerospora hongkongensis TaxID=244830 RepID=UPI00289D1549|nr:flagellar filament capping protein FliD [Anaerospora hongkongensis]
MSTSSSVTSTTVNGTTRITGLASGLDVDSIVTQLMSAEKTKLNKLQQKQQLAEWRQESYRTIITAAQEFTSKYFNTTSSSSLLSANTFIKYSVTSSSSAISASASSSASAGNHTVQVSRLATAATLTSSSSISKDVQGSAAADYSSLSGKSITLAVDGTTRTVSLSNVTDADSLQTAIDEAVGTGKLTVGTTTDGYLSITAAANSGVQKITISAPSSGTSGLTSLGFGSGATLSNRVTTTSTLETIFGDDAFNSDGQIELTINGTSFTFDKSDTLSAMMSEINSSSNAEATMKYDELSGKLTLTANETGAGNTLAVTEGDGSSFFSSFLNTATAGVDAQVTIDGQVLTRGSNKVTVDGVTYTFSQTTDEAATVSLTQDTDAIYDTISSFVEDYNALISSIHSALDENYDSDYPPLTDDQKEDMTDEEIEKWEKKAKVGLLANDSTLKTMLSGLRSSLIDSVPGQSVTIFTIGISTGTYDEQGKLYIDETKLKAAIESDPEGISNLFTQQSTSYAGTTSVRSLNNSQLSTRYKEEGLAYRFYDILQTNISTIRDNNGNKGLLLEKAGTENDASETSNTLTTLIDKYQEEIDKEQDRLDAKQDSLYTKYSALETYINKMNTQLSALSSYLSDSTS